MQCKPVERLVDELPIAPQREPDEIEGRRRNRGNDRAVRGIVAGGAEKITMDELAADAGISRFRLTRAFVAAHGLPPHAYLLSVRLNAARQRLAAGEGAADVAASCGFTDQAHLTREFRRRFGTTPGTYRAAARGRR